MVQPNASPNFKIYCETSPLRQSCGTHQGLAGSAFVRLNVLLLRHSRVERTEDLAPLWRRLS
jgi:hypothetical protein